MSAKWQRIRIDIDPRIKPADRVALADDIIEHIYERTTVQNLDRRNRQFARYSKSYIKSAEFKGAGKSPGDVDLQLTGDMLAALDLLSHKSGSLLIGFEPGTEENAKADGNIRGTYGKTEGTGPRRDFLGLTRAKLRELQREYL